MFGKDKKDDRPIGATEKLKRAKKLKAMGYFDTLNPAQHGETEKRWQTTLSIFVLALVLSWLLTDGPIATGNWAATGIPLLDGFVFAAQPPALVGIAFGDLVATVVLRALLLLAAAGFLPLVAWLWAEIIDRPLMNPYRTVWGVTLGLGVIALLLKPVFALMATNFATLAQ